MAKRFILSSESLEKTQELALVTLFNEEKIQWWHWLPNFWLLIAGDQPTVIGLSKSIRLLFDDLEFAILEVTGKTDWSTALKNTPGKDKTKWLTNEWDVYG